MAAVVTVMDEHRLRGFGSTVRVGLALLAAAAVAPQRAARASAIHAEALKFTTEADLGPRWKSFLAGGPALWAITTPPSFPSHLVLYYQANGVPVETPFVDYLIWRRNLDPLRFDANHPGAGPVLELIKPPKTPSSTPPAGQNLTPPSVPEPAALTVALTTAAAALGWRHRCRLQRGGENLYG